MKRSRAILFSGGTSARLSSAFLLIGGFALVVVGAWFATETARFVERADRAQGVVEEIVSKRGARGQKLYHPVVRYHTATGVEIVFTAKPGLWPSPFDVGDRVAVAYEPADPQNARIISFWMLWFLPLVMILLGGGCVVAAWYTPGDRGTAPFS